MMSISKIVALTVLSIICLCSVATAFAPTPFICSKSPSASAITKQFTPQNCKQTNNERKHLVIYNTESDVEAEESEEDAKKRVQQEIFWAKQRALAAQFEAQEDAGVKAANRDKFAKRRLALVSDTVYFSVLIACLLWLASTNPFVTISYLFGAMSGTAYSYGLGKYVETIGGSIDDTEIEGAGIGQARFAFLILLFVVVGKFRSQGLLEIPSIMGFFTYQLASLGQGLREIDD
eukprot:scaffold14028_cov123-Skeletonema_dohrnii-CCMP3373.AAC.1